MEEKKVKTGEKTSPRLKNGRKSQSPFKKPRNPYEVTKEEEYETVFEKSFEILDLNSTDSNWYAVRVLGMLPSKRSNHTSVIYENQ